MKSPSLNFICTFAIATIVFQSVGVESVDAQERMFGNGRFIKRVFGDFSPQAAPAKKPTPAPVAKKRPTQAKQPTLANRPSQNAQPTLANQAVRARGANPRSIQPARSDANHASINRLPKSTASVDADSIPTRSNAKATLGFGMLVELENDQLYVSRLDPKGNAANSGVQVGDRLVAGGGIDFESLADYNGIGDILQDGDQLEFEIERRGHEKEMMIIFGKASEGQAAMIEGNVQNQQSHKTTRGRSMQTPKVGQINTRANNSFLPTQQNTTVEQPNHTFSSNGRQTSGQSNPSRTIQSQQSPIGSQLRQQDVSTPAPSLQLPPSAESVLN